MGLITKDVEVTLNSANMQHFKDLGYELPTIIGKNGKPRRVGAKMIVPIDDLNHGSNYRVDVECDMCHKEILHIPYGNYISRMEKDGHIYCKQCGYKQVKLTNLNRYGVEYYLQTQECQDKKRATCMEKYGVPVCSQSEQVKAKFRETCLDKYGVDHPWKVDEIKAKVDTTIKEKYGVDNISQLEEIKQKKAQSNLEHTGYAYNLQNPEIFEKAKVANSEIWGTDYPMQSELFAKKMIELYGTSNPNNVPEIREKIQTTNLERYGGTTPFSSLEIQEKIRVSMYKNGNVPTSTQQKAIYDFYKSIYPQTELNFPIGKAYLGDIVIDNIDFEVDYGGHNLSVIRGTLSQEDFNQKELIRDKVVKSNGYKIIRLITNIERGIPSDDILLEILEISKQYFQDNPERSWINWDIDNSIYRNALNLEGVLFNYGELRRLNKAA